jgi:biopolymer transport protein ExbB
MLGLLGTVTGIVETFDLIRVFGSAEIRIIARGVSQALITTLAGLVRGLFGVGAGYDLERRAAACTAQINHLLKP